MMKYSLIAVSAILGVASCGSGAKPETSEDSLRFDPQAYRIDSLTMPTGEVVKFKAYEGIYYVKKTQTGTLLRNKGYDVDFALPWNRPHSGDYNLDDLFAWIKTTMNNPK